jgi:anti-sigma B factor antagonist
VPASFAISDSKSGGIATIELVGEIDIAAKPALCEFVEKQLGDDSVTGVVVEVSRVTFLDSTGIGALIRCRREAETAGKTLRVHGVRGRVAAVLDLTGVTRLLTGEPPAGEPGANDLA